MDDDSDEYFGDPIVLDEAALASIQATEEHFAASFSQPHRTHSQPPPPQIPSLPHPPRSHPPLKRLKTSDGWIQVTDSHASPSQLTLQSMELDPDIRVGPDGQYVIGSQYHVSGEAPSSGKGQSVSGSTYQLVSRDHGAASTNPHAGEVAVHLGDVAPRSQLDSADLQAEISSVRAQLAEITAKNVTIQRLLQQAQDAQLVKTGEVSILRQTIDKNKREHAEAMVKIKADMIAHERVKTELQVKLKEETERMATRLIFKQHEIDTSTRKPTWSSVRLRRAPPDQPRPGPAVAETPTRSRDLHQSPLPGRAASQAPQGQNWGKEGVDKPFLSPTTSRVSRRHGEEVKQPRFQGFHNSFMDSGPAEATSRGDSEAETQEIDPFSAPIDRKESRDAFMLMHQSGEQDGDLEINGKGIELSMFSAGRVGGEDATIEEKSDRLEELRRIVFTHIAPHNDVLTLHIILSTIIPTEERSEYTKACQVILESCGIRHESAGCPEQARWEVDVVDKVANAFATVCGVLSRAGCIVPLTALLDLLLSLTLYIPAFLASFLASSHDNFDRHLASTQLSGLLSVLCDIVRVHLIPSKLGAQVTLHVHGKENPQAGLAMAVVRLLECFCWNVKDCFLERLGLLPCQQQLLDILLDPVQTPELIVRTLQLLVVLATHQNIFRFLIPYHDTDTADDSRGPLPKGKILETSLIEKLCYHLVEPAAEEPFRIRYLIATLFTLLADSHLDVRTSLLDTVCVAPSLVICITKLSRLLWEDDVTVMDNHELAKLVVETLYLSVNFLHHLVFTYDLASVVGRKLVEVTRSSGSFNGVTHMFIVTFGRLSWAEVPDWLDQECKEMCDLIAELSVEITESIVAGPECDSLWGVWHQFSVSSDKMDDAADGPRE